MDTRVHARFFRASASAAGAKALKDVLLEAAKEPSPGKRERDLGEGITTRLERCTVDGEFLDGELCRVQTVNFPPQAGPDGLEPISLGKGKGIGHVVAFRYHMPTRVLLIQRNILSVTANRLALYVAAVDAGNFVAFAPVLGVDAMERFKKKKPRAFEVTFAGVDNLASFDDETLPIAKGARLIAEAYDGVRVTVAVSVGKSRKLNLDKDALLTALGKLTELAGVKKLKVKAATAEEDDVINFLKEQLHGEDTLKLPEGDPNKNYEARRLFLKKVFSDNMAPIKAQFK